MRMPTIPMLKTKAVGAQHTRDCGQAGIEDRSCAVTGSSGYILVGNMLTQDGTSATVQQGSLLSEPLL
jgi:hypothetical protein